MESDRVGLAEARRLGQRRWALLLLTNAIANAIWTGDWDWALAELAEALTGDLEREDRFLVLGRVAGFRAWRGDPVDALLEEMQGLVGATPDPNHAQMLTVVRAIRAFAQGEFEETRAMFRQLALIDAGNANGYLVLAARAALLDRDAASAAADLESLKPTGVHGIWADARGTSIRAGLAALDGRPADAISLYRAALRGLRDAGTPLDEALTAIEMATLLDPAEPEVRAAADAAREILTRLRATPFLHRLEEAVGRVPVPASPRRTAAPGVPGAPIPAPGAPGA